MSDDSIEPIDEQLLEHVSRPVAFFDADGIIVRTNRAWELFLCEPSEALLILSYEELTEQLRLPTFDAMQMQDSSKGLFNNKTVIVTRYRLLSRKTTGIMVEIDDFTRYTRKTARIAGTIADSLMKIRSRITAVENAMTLLVEYPPGDFSGETTELLTAARREMWELSRHIDYLGDLTSFDSGSFIRQIHPEMIVLQELLDFVQIECSPVLPADQVDTLLHFDLEEDCQLFSDRHICQHVITTVVANAIVYSNPDRSVTIRARREGDSSVRITVSDTGWGIPQEEQWRIFSYGFRGAKATETGTAGLGTGLYLARKMLGMVNSEIWFTSKPGSGTQFEILLREMQRHGG